MHTLMRISVLAVLLLSSTALAFASDGVDSRMMVELHSTDIPAGQAQNILTDIPDMAKIGIIKLWNRLVPQNRVAEVSGADAMALLQRAVPMDDGGLRLIFSHGRVIQYLKSLGITYPLEPPHFDLKIKMTNPAGVLMPQSEAALMNYARQNSEKWGYIIDDSGDPLNLSWQWLSNQQVSLTVKGNPRLTEMQSIRFMAAGDPMPQIQAWLDEVMLDARDAYDIQPANLTANPKGILTKNTNIAKSNSTSLALTLTVAQPATLAEQVVFEQALAANSHVKSIQLKMVDANTRQYLLQLHQPGTDWLPAWFASRGMQAILTDGGWIAR